MVPIMQELLWISWTEDDIERVASEILVQKKMRYAQIKAIPAEKRTFANTVKPWDTLGHEILPNFYAIEFLMNVSPDASLRNKAQEILNALKKKLLDIEYRENILEAFKEYASLGEQLEGAEKKLFEEALRDYRRMGFDLPDEKRNEYKDILKELSEQGAVFRKRINDYQDSITLVPEETEGLPSRYLEGLKRNEEGKYVVTLQYPDSIPFMENAAHAGKRKELADKNLHKGGEENMKTLRRMVELRDKQAKLLGYADHVAYQTEIRMVETSGRAFAFVQDLLTALKPMAEKDMEELTALKREMTGDPQARIEYYDVAYYTNEHKKRTLNIDSEAIREYFPLEHVKKELFSLYSRLFSVSFEEVAQAPVWHEDVKMYVMKDSSGNRIANFFMDLHPRDGKYGHAAAFGLRDGGETSEGERILPLCALVTNFPKSMPESPSLLSHDEIETLFHEFGHIIHFCLYRGKFQAQTSFATVLDFVEAPSQMLENWVWRREVLDTLSSHFQRPSESLPAELLGNLLKGKYHMIGYWATRQLISALFDLTIHSGGASQDYVKIYNDLVREHVGIIMEPTNIFPAGFGHLDEYSAGYYGYMWSRVYASDMFTRFEKEGVLNEKTGFDYRTHILEKGSSQKEIELVEAFLGREPNNEAFLREIGLGT